MDIPGKNPGSDADVNINVEGDTENLSATQKALDSLRNAIANLGRSAESADDDVDDLEDEMREAGAAGVEGAAGVSTFAGASRAAEEAVDDLNDEIDDVDFDPGSSGAVLWEEIAKVADNVDDTVDAFDRLDDAGPDDIDDPFSALANADEAAESVEELSDAVEESSGDGSAFSPDPSQFDDSTNLAKLNPRFFQQGAVSDITSPELSDFTLNDDDGRRDRRFDEIAYRLSTISGAGDLIDLNQVSKKRLDEFVNRASASNLQTTEFLRENQGMVFPQGAGKTIFEDLLKEDGTITPDSFKDKIEERYSDELEVARKRERTLNEIGDLLDESSRSVRQAFGSLDDFDDDGATTFNRVFSQLEGDLFDDEQAQQAFQDLLENDVDELLGSDDKFRSSRRTRSLEGFSTTSQLIEAFESDVFSEIRDSNRIDPDRGQRMLQQILAPGDERFALSSFDPKDIKGRINELRAESEYTADELNEMQSILSRFGTNTRDIRQGEHGSAFSGIAQRVASEGKLTDILPIIDEAEGMFGESITKEEDIRDKKNIAEVIDTVTGDSELLGVINTALSDDGSLNRNQLAQAVDQSNLEGDRIQDLYAFADVIGEDIFGTDSAEYRDIGTTDFPSDIRGIDQMVDSMIGGSSPAEREPLNRAIRDLDRQNVPLAEETVRANLFQQAANTDSEEFKRLINDVDRMIKDNKIEIGSLLDMSDAEPMFQEQIDRELRKTGISDSAADDLTAEIFEDLQNSLRDYDNIDSVDSFFFDEDSPNLRDVLAIDRSDIEEYDASWEQILESAEDGTKKVRRFYEQLAGEDVDQIDDTESLLQSWGDFLDRVDDRKVRELFGDRQLTPIDMRLRRFIQRSAAGRGTGSDSSILQGASSGIRRFTEALPNRLVETDTEAMEASGGIRRLRNMIKTLTPELGITSANLGPLNISLRNMGSVIVGLVSVLGPFLALVGGLATGFVALAGAIGSVTALGALGFFEQIEEQFAGINNRMEAMEATFNAFRTMARDALAPLENAEIGGLTSIQLFQRAVQRSVQFLNHFARVFAMIAEHEATAEAMERISDALFEPNSQGGGVRMMEAMRIATEKLVPIVTDLLVYLIDNFPEFIIFISRISDMIDGPLAYALTEWIDLFGDLITVGAGFVWVYANVAGVIADVVNQLGRLIDLIDVLPDSIFDADDGDGMSLLFGIGGSLGFLFALSAAVTVFMKFAKGATIAANAFGKLLSVLGRGGKISRFGKFLSGFGGSGSATISPKGAGSTVSPKPGRGASTLGKVGRFLPNSLTRPMGFISKMRGRETGLIPRLLGGAGNNNLADMMKRAAKPFTDGLRGLLGGGGRGQMTLIDVFAKLADLGSKVGRFLGPIAKLGKFLFRFLNPLLWLLDIITAIKEIWKDVQFLLGNRQATDSEIFGAADKSSFTAEERRQMRERANNRSTVTTGLGENRVTVNVNGNPDDPDNLVTAVRRAIVQSAQQSDRHYGESKPRQT